MKERVCKYLITDGSGAGTLVSGRMEHTEMLLLLGTICLDAHEVPEVVRILCEDFLFDVITEDLPEGQAMADVVLDACTRGDGTSCSRADISAVRKRFSGKDAEAMLRSIDWSDVRKENVS